MCKEWCDGLNRLGLCRLLCLSTWPIESDTIRRCGLVGVDAVLLEEACHCGERL